MLVMLFIVVLVNDSVIVKTTQQFECTLFSTPSGTWSRRCTKKCFAIKQYWLNLMFVDIRRYFKSPVRASQRSTCKPGVLDVTTARVGYDYCLLYFPIQVLITKESYPRCSRWSLTIISQSMWSACDARFFRLVSHLVDFACSAFLLEDYSCKVLQKKEGSDSRAKNVPFGSAFYIDCTSLWKFLQDPSRGSIFKFLLVVTRLT